MTRTQKKINQKGNYYCKGCPAFLLRLVRITQFGRKVLGANKGSGIYI